MKKKWIKSKMKRGWRKKMCFFFFFLFFQNSILTSFPFYKFFFSRFTFLTQNHFVSIVNWELLHHGRRGEVEKKYDSNFFQSSILEDKKLLFFSHLHMQNFFSRDVLMNNIHTVFIEFIFFREKKFACSS